MNEDFPVLYFKETKFAPDWVKSPYRKIELTQIEFSLNDETFLFPDCDNIFSRAESAKAWWFLVPEIKGCDIYQSDENISEWWEILQEIYNSSILTKVSPMKTLGFVSWFDGLNNYLVDSLLSQLNFRANRVDQDPETSEFSICYYYNFFHDMDSVKYWHYWLLQKAIINYYQTLFCPALKQRNNIRENLRLANRFPKYACAIEWLEGFRSSLYKERAKEYVDEFFDIQSRDRENEVRITKKLFGKFAPQFFCQCRVCGLVFCPFVKFDGLGKSIGEHTKICGAPACEKAWDLLRKRLPPIPNDVDAGSILLSHI
jgi:hypothetical protein